jgi:hypothetical protein
MSLRMGPAVLDAVLREYALANRYGQSAEGRSSAAGWTRRRLAPLQKLWRALTGPAPGERGAPRSRGPDALVSGSGRGAAPCGCG